MKLEQLGHEIRRARLIKGLTQAQLASAAGITRTTLNQLENGLVNDLGIRKVEALLRIAAAIGIPEGSGSWLIND